MIHLFALSAMVREGKKGEWKFILIIIFTAMSSHQLSEFVRRFSSLFSSFLLCAFKFFPCKVLDKHFSINFYLLPPTFLCPHTRIYLCILLRAHKQQQQQQQVDGSNIIAFMCFTYFFNGFPLVSLFEKNLSRWHSHCQAHSHTDIRRYDESDREKILHARE